jgi:hypothetical protein
MLVMKRTLFRLSLSGFSDSISVDMLFGNKNNQPNRETGQSGAVIL